MVPLTALTIVPQLVLKPLQTDCRDAQQPMLVGKYLCWAKVYSELDRHFIAAGSLQCECFESHPLAIFVIESSW